MATTDHTPCPVDLDSASKALWTKTRDGLKVARRWRPEYSPLLERYVRALEVARVIRGRIAKRAKADPGSAYTTTGSQGQLVQHPDVKTARDAERDADKYAAELMLTPAAQASRPDEKPPTGKFGGAFG
jgi:phage terminase small subunit